MKQSELLAALAAMLSNQSAPATAVTNAVSKRTSKSKATAPAQAKPAADPNGRAKLWTRDNASDGVSAAGYPYVAYSVPTRGNRPFVVRIPADLVSAIKTGL